MVEVDRDSCSPICSCGLVCPYIVSLPEGEWEETERSVNLAD